MNTKDRSERLVEGVRVIDPRDLQPGDIIHIRWRGIDRDYRVTVVNSKAITAVYHYERGIGYVTLPIAGWGVVLGDPMEVTFVNRPGT